MTLKELLSTIDCFEAQRLLRGLITGKDQSKKIMYYELQGMEDTKNAIHDHLNDQGWQHWPVGTDHGSFLSTSQHRFKEGILFSIYCYRDINSLDFWNIEVGLSPFDQNDHRAEHKVRTPHAQKKSVQKQIAKYSRKRREERDAKYGYANIPARHD